MKFEFYVLLLIYPLMFLAYKPLKNLINRKTLVSYLSVLAFGIFYYSFSTYIVLKTEIFSFVIITFLYFVTVYQVAKKLSDLFKIFTYYWLILLGVWGFILLDDYFLIIGAMSIFSYVTKENRIIEFTGLWILIVLFSKIMGEMDLVTNASIKLMFSEVYFFLILMLMLSLSQMSSKVKLLNNIFIVVTFSILFRSGNLMPYLFEMILLTAVGYLLIDRYIDISSKRSELFYPLSMIMFLPSLTMKSSVVLLITVAMLIEYYHQRKKIPYLNYIRILVLVLFCNYLYLSFSLISIPSKVTGLLVVIYQVILLTNNRQKCSINTTKIVTS
jgi:hypothetical protein